MSTIRPIDHHGFKHDLHTAIDKQKVIVSTPTTPDTNLQKMEHIGKAVGQARTLLQRRVRLNQLSSNQNYGETPTLSTEDGEDVFAKLHGLNSKTVLQGKARQFLQRMRRQNQYNGQPIIEEDEQKLNRPINISNGNEESSEFAQQQQRSIDELFKQEMQETLGEEVSNLDMYLILGQAKQLLAQENSKLSKDVVGQLDAVFAEHSDEIITKVNSIDEASTYGGNNKKQVTQFLEAYYTFIFKVRTPNDMLMVYLNSFDRAEFEQISNLFTIANLKAQHQRLLPCIHQNTMNDILPFMNNRAAIFSLLDYIAASKDKLAKRFDKLQQTNTPQVNERSLLKSIQELFGQDEEKDLKKEVIEVEDVLKKHKQNHKHRQGEDDESNKDSDTQDNYDDDLFED